jgi:hypothetical protein
MWINNKKRNGSVNSAGSRDSADLTYGDFGVDLNIDENTVYTVPEETRLSMRRLSNFTSGDMRSSVSQNDSSSSSHSSKFNSTYGGRRNSSSSYYSRGSISIRDSIGSAKISRRTSSIDPVEEEGGGEGEDEYVDDEKPNASRDM